MDMISKEVMAMWKIIPLDLGLIEVARSSNLMQANARAGELVQNVSIAWLLENRSDGRIILIDTGGVEDDEWSRKYHVPSSRQREDQYLIPALAKHGVDPERIETIILTHLHWDHAYGVSKIPNAKVYVQMKEIVHAVSRHRIDAKTYETNIPGVMPFFLEFYDRMAFIDGDCEIVEGLTTLLLPGHTPGSQGVLVDSGDARYVITGDLINCLENWTQRIPCGLHTDVMACYASFDKLEAIEKIGAVVLPSHDNTAIDLFCK